MKKKEKGRSTLEFRQYAVGRMKVCPNILALAKELGVPRAALNHLIPRTNVPQVRPNLMKVGRGQSRDSYQICS